MVLVAIALYVLPLALLRAAWNNRQAPGNTPAWRRNTALLGFCAVCAIAGLELIFTMSWLHSGGSPHGLEPAPGLWTMIRPVLKWVYIVALILPIFGKGRERLFQYLSVIATFGVVSLVYLLQMD